MIPLTEKYLVIFVVCISFILISILQVTGTTITCADRIWAISHLVNNEQNLDHSLEVGANGLEMDLNFNKSGHPENLYHSDGVVAFCDCTCAKHTESCQFDPCGKKRPVEVVMKYFMSHKKMGQVAIFYVDSKLDGVPNDMIKQAGENAVTFFEEAVLKRGYKGIIFISGNNDEYLRSSVAQATQSKFKSQIFIGYDYSFKFKHGLEVVADLKYPNKIISTGIARCVSGALHYIYSDWVILGSVNKGRGVLSETIIWTLDTEKEFDEHFSYGARGIISNNVGKLVSWAEKRGYQLYTTEDAICGATAGTENLVNDVGSCSCKKGHGGCKIDKKVTTWGSACKCSEHFLGLVCKGDVVGCRDVTSYYCTNPDESEASCMQGGGNCDGY